MTSRFRQVGLRVSSLAFMLVLFGVETSSALDLNSFLAQVELRHRGLRALDVSQEAFENKKLAGDLSLVPSLQLKIQSAKDEKAPNLYGATASLANTASLGFSQKFATGTVLGLSGQVGLFENQNIAAAQAAALGKYANGSLAFTISQSLWKDAFGQATTLRRSREKSINEAEKLGLIIQKQKLLIDAERAYWDLITIQEELQLRRANLERAQKIESWVARRYADGIADKADWLNAKALAVTRRLQLFSSEDDFRGAQAKIRETLELKENEALPPLEGSLSLTRSPFHYVLNQQGRLGSGELGKGDISSAAKEAGKEAVIEAVIENGRIESLEARAKFFEAQIKRTVASEVQESLKADLSVFGSYASNPYKPDGSLDYAMSNLGDFGRPTAAVGLSWTYLFDGPVKAAQKNQAQKEALSSLWQKERAEVESASQWKEYQRRSAELAKKITAAQEISRLQRDRAKVEQDKFSKGRAITQAVITAEQDAAEAELVWTKLKAEQRKLETQGRFFVVISPNEEKELGMEMNKGAQP